jgi:hypothetical protein
MVQNVISTSHLTYLKHTKSLQTCQIPEKSQRMNKHAPVNCSTSNIRTLVVLTQIRRSPTFRLDLTVLHHALV